MNFTATAAKSTKEEVLKRVDHKGLDTTITYQIEK